MSKSEMTTKAPMELCYEKLPTKENLKELDKDISTNYGYGVRHVQLVIFFMCTCVSFLARSHLGVTIVAMADIEQKDVEKELPMNETYFGVTVNVTDFRKAFDNDTEIYGVFQNTTNFEEVNQKMEDVDENFTQSAWNVYRTYSWSKPYQEMILSSFFLGYCIMMFPIGLVCQRWGGKLPFQISLFTNGAVSILTPWATAWGGWKAVCACRIVQGLAQSGTFPGIQALLARWVPRNERGTFSSYVYAGVTLGSVIGLQLGGLLADSKWGWPSTYWAVGLICIAAGIIITFFGTASPDENRFISEEEKFYILSRIDGGGVKNRNIPWKAILRSKHVWANIVTHVGSTVTFVFFFTQVPSFIHYTYNIDVTKSGLLSSLPYVASFFTSIAYGVLSDYFTNNNIVTLKTARRISNSMSQIGIGISLILASFAGTSSIAVTCLVFAMSFHMGVHTGWMINHMDLTPNYCGTLMTIGNTMYNIFVLLIPVAVSQIVVDVKNQHQWQIMFGMMAALAIVSNIIFVLFLSTDTQPWNDYQEAQEYEEAAVIDKSEPAKGGNN